MTAVAAALEDMSLGSATGAMEDDTTNQIHATVRNGYEEDYEDLDPMMSQVEHACRCVSDL